MKIKESELYKYLEIVLSESEIANSNSAKNILHEKYLNPITEEERDEYFEICKSVVNLGVKLGYFKYLSKETDWFDLSEKGIKAKSIGGHLKFLDYIEQKELERTKPTIITENYIGGDNNGIQSSKGDIYKPIINNNSSEGKTSLLEKLSWVAGIISLLIVLYQIYKD